MTNRKKKSSANSSANLSFEAKLWLAADQLRNNMDAAEYGRQAPPAQPQTLDGGYSPNRVHP